MKLTHIIEEAARWKREVAAGNLSSESIKRIKKEGVAKTPEEYAAGLRRGSENIAKQAGFNINTDKMAFTKNPLDALTGALLGGHYTSPLKNVVRSPDEMGIVNKALTPLKNLNPIERELALRHEANEAKYFNQEFRKTGFLPQPKARVGVNNKLVGNHYSMKVIADEAKDANFYKNLFGYDAFNKARKSRENVVLKDKFGVGYDDINFDNVKQLKRKIDNYERKVIDNEIMQRNMNLVNSFSDLFQSKGLLNKLKAAKNVGKTYKDSLLSPYEGYNTNISKAKPNNAHEELVNKILKARSRS